MRPDRDPQVFFDWHGSLTGPEMLPGPSCLGVLAGLPWTT